MTSDKAAPTGRDRRTVLVTTEARLLLSREGNPVSNVGLDYDFWTRYLSAFDRVTVLARVQQSDVPVGHLHASGYRPVEGPGVALTALPDYRGLTGFLASHRSIRRTVAALIPAVDAVILRIPSPIASLVSRRLGHRQGYGVEVVGDPRDALGPLGIKHPLRPLLRWAMTRAQRRLCHEARASAYVTEYTLQNRYPPHPGRFTTNYSSIDLDDDALRRPVPGSGRAIRIVTVAALDQPYKGVDVLIDAVAECRARGLEVDLVVVGGGTNRAALEQHARRVAPGHVIFTGYLPAGDAVRRELDRADVFVLASLAEGLPRAMIEAMARGLPSIGSNIGGIPELLAADDLVEPGSPTDLADHIGRFADPSLRLIKGMRNHAVARRHHIASITKRRQSFYEAVLADARRPAGHAQASVKDPG